MTTTTKNTTRTSPADIDVDFDTRLTLAGIGMDVALEAAGGDDLKAARGAASQAVTETASSPWLPVSVPAVGALAPHPILADAADVIRERGWFQGNLVSPSGAVCARGAIRIAAKGSALAEQHAEETLLFRIWHET